MAIPGDPESEAPEQKRPWYHRNLEPFQFPDFRLLWIGALLSNFGGWVQSTAQGWLVYELTRDVEKLALIGFANMLPVSILGPFAGTLTDTLNRRAVLIICQAIFAVNAAFIALATFGGWIEFWHLLMVAIINGITSTVEMPMRQSLLSKVVPMRLVPVAIPWQAITFNLARVVGPALGGILLHYIGAQACYSVNAISFFALIFAVIGIKADLSATASEPQPIADLLMEGIKYTFMDVRLKTLFLMEATTAVFGLAYFQFIPAFARDILKVNEIGLSQIYSAIGIGAVTGLFALTGLGGKPIKANLIRIAMTTLGTFLILLTLFPVAPLAYFFFAVLGASTIMQFNNTNSLFQTIAPDRLRGRVIAMHVWAISGAAPIGLPLFGRLAKEYGPLVSIRIGGCIVLVAAVLAWIYRSRLKNVE